jgi:WD40 repeat protein
MGCDKWPRNTIFFESFKLGFSVTFSSDGKQLLIGGGESYDDTLQLYDVASGQKVGTFLGHTNWVLSVAFSPDGKQILSGSADKTVKLWDVASGREIKTFLGHTGFVESVVFINDGKQALSGSDDGIVKLWDISNGKEIAQFVSFKNGEWVVITSEGYYNASPNGDQYLNVRVGNNAYGIDQYRATFYKPALVALAFSGDRNAYLAAVRQSGKTVQDANIAPPQVTISTPSSVISNRTNISVSVDGGTQSIQYLTVKINGKIVARDMGVTPVGTKGLAPMARLNVLAEGNTSRKRTNFNLDIPLDPGNNIIEVLAFNGYSEGRAITIVYYMTTQRNFPNLYIHQSRERLGDTPHPVVQPLRK